MATTTERLELLITAKVNDAIGGLKQAEGSVGGIAGKMDALDAKMAPLNGKLQSLGLSGVSSGAMVAAGAGAAVAGLGALAVWTQKGIEKQVELADSVRGVVAVSGLSAEQASRLVEVTGDYGIQIGTVEKAFWKLSSTVDDNRQKIEQHGIKIRENKDGTVDLMGTVENIQKAYVNAGSAVEKNQILFDAFGKSGKELIPVLEETGSLAQALADVPESRILSEDDLQKARDYQLAMDDLRDAFDALQRDLGTMVIPVITEWANTVSGVVETVNTLKGAIPDVGAFGGAMKDAFVDAIPGLGPTVGLMKDLGGIFGSGKDDALSYADAQKAVQEATKKVSDAAGEGKDKANDLRDAQKELAAAKEQLEAKTKAVSDALQTENDKTREAIQLADQRLGGILGVYGADLQYQQALVDHAAKQETLTRLEAEGKQGTEEYETAKRALEQADLALVQSALSLEGQITSLKEQVDSGKLSTEEYQARIDELKAKYPELGGAIDEITGKVREHTGAIDAVPTDKHTNFTADASQAEAVIDSLWRKIGSIPNSVFTNFGASLKGAVGAEGAIVNRPTIALIGEAGPEMLVPLHKMPGNQPVPDFGSGGRMGGNTYQISVSVGPGGNPAEVGRAVVESIKQYERRAGTSWRN